jgi:hypothetical protein
MWAVWPQEMNKTAFKVVISPRALHSNSPLTPTCRVFHSLAVAASDSGIVRNQDRICDQPKGSGIILVTWLPGVPNHFLLSLTYQTLSLRLGGMNIARQCGRNVAI